MNDADGNEVSDKEGLSNLAKTYFEGLFTASSEEVLYGELPIEHEILVEENNSLVARFLLEDFTGAITQMFPDKVPGPDGLNPGFYQHFWNLLGLEVFQTTIGWLENLSFPSNLNDTLICLIPKCTDPQSMKNLRPISLFNVIYKIISKVLANRMKHILSHIISSTQSAFAPGRSINDNVIIDCELLHYMNRKQRGNVGEVSLKLDISKACDRVDWKFLHHMLRILGFDDGWIKWIMMCVTFIRYYVLMNGSEVSRIIPKRGLRQGCPLSPYLFIICAEGLSALLRQAESSGLINGSKVCRGAPSISHLFFADDSFLFFKSTKEETRVIHRILELYECYSG